MNYATKYATTPPPTLETLPEEIKLRIALHLFAFSRGIHSHRWPILKHARVDLLQFIKGFSHLIPEALYKYNLLILRPICGYSDPISSLRRHRDNYREPAPYPEMMFRYPPPKINVWVRRLEFLFNLYIPPDIGLFLEKQVAQLRRLVSGRIGFQNLTFFRLAFEEKARGSMEEKSALMVLLVNLQEGGKLVVKAREVQVVVSDLAWRQYDAKLNWKAKLNESLPQELGEMEDRLRRLIVADPSLRS